VARARAPSGACGLGGVIGSFFWLVIFLCSA